MKIKYQWICIFLCICMIAGFAIPVSANAAEHEPPHTRSGGCTVTFSVLGDTGVIEPMICSTETGITLPVAEAPAGYRFLGWVEQDYDNVTAQPETILTGAYTASEDITLLALFTYNDYGGNPPKLELMTTEDTFADGDKIVIVESGGAHGLYQKTFNTTYVSDFDFTNDAEAILADELTYFNVTKVKDGWYLGDETNGWLYTPDNSVYLSIRQNTAFMTAFTLTTLDGHLALQHTVSYNNNVFYLNCGTNYSGMIANKWRMVNANNMAGVSTLDIYKLSEGGPATARYTTVMKPSHTHTPGEPVTENQLAPTCEASGSYDSVVYCSVCGEELSREHMEIPATGHDWDNPEYVWADDCSTVTATRICNNDAGHVETETVGTTSVVTAEATYEEAGEITYTAVFTNPAFETQIQKVATPKLEDPGDGLPCDGSDSCPGSKFTDMPPKGNWAHDPIDWAIVHGVTAGTSETTFSPNAGCTRAQVVTFLWRAAGEPEPVTDSNPFRDVKTGAYYYKAVLWAVENKVTAGTARDKFSPDATCTRAQIVTFLWRYEGTPEPTTAVNPFRDVKAGAYYEKAVLWASETGVTAGTTATTFSPDATCTRAQVVTFLYRDLVK